jgi:lipoprotein-anchoring transpeptidase ErfK/SrfK
MRAPMRPGAAGGKLGQVRERFQARRRPALLAAAVVALAVVLITATALGPATRPRFRRLPPGALTFISPDPPAALDASIPPGPGALVARISRTVAMRSAPDGSVLARVGTRTAFGSAQAFWVVARRGRWFGVVSPQAGNARLGWVPASAVTLSRDRWQLRVSLSARRVEVLEGGRVIRRYTVAVGEPSAPTPTGRFAVTDRLYTGDPTGPYGCCILALSANAPHAIQGWSGGTRIAIHSTPDTGSIGLPVSHGCLRLTLAEGRWLLGHVPVGTPTLIGA